MNRRGRILSRAGRRDGFVQLMGGRRMGWRGGGGR